MERPVDEHGGTAVSVEAGEPERSSADISVHDWRLDQLPALGFEETSAELLADSTDVDLGRARSLVKAGCRLALVLPIVL